MSVSTTSAKTPSGEMAIPHGELNCANVPAPFAKLDPPEPARVVMGAAAFGRTEKEQKHMGFVRSKEIFHIGTKTALYN